MPAEKPLTASCSCAKCADLCKRNPGWFTPAEANRAMDAGLAPRLMRDWLEKEPHAGIPCNVFVLAPAVIGYQGEDAPQISLLEWLTTGGARGRCTFLNSSDLCDLHETDHKPNQCRMAYGCAPCDACPDNREVGMLWHSDEGRAAIARWQQLTNNVSALI